jgi:cytochrome c-type biogenesis protein
MAEYVEAFTLGNAAILTNVCLLPLYPGFLVMLAGQLQTNSKRWVRALLGLIVVAGLVTFMVAIGFVLYQLRRSTADLLGWLLPTMYALVAVLGAAMVVGFNPFGRLTTVSVPLLRSPGARAYAYGIFLAPMTLPCTGPLIVSAFVIGGVSGGDALVDSIIYFVAFALGFGWPLVVLPLLALPAQRQLTRFAARHHRIIGMLSGVMLLVVAAIGFWFEVRDGA